MVDWITNTIQTVGYLGITFLMFLENVFPPIPSELVMPFAGMVASRGSMSLFLVIVAGTIGAVLGALPLYYLGYFIGKERLAEWADRHGAWLAVCGEDIEKAGRWFDRHGGAVVFFGRLIPGIRSIISIPAGADRMPLVRFLLYTTAGTAIWTAALAYLGKILGENYDLVHQYLEPVSWIVIGGIVLSLLYRIVKHHLSSDRRPRSGQSGPA